MPSPKVDLIMKRKNITFIFFTALISVIVCLQFFNHFVMLKGNESDCLCSCKVEPGVTPANKEPEVDQDPQYPVDKEKMFDDTLNQMLDLLDNMNEIQQSSFGASLHEQLIELLSSIKENRDSTSNARKLKEEVVYTEHMAEPAEIQEVCPEKFMGNALTYGYPFFRKGFATVNCSQYIPMHDLVTLIFDDLHTSRLDPPAYKRVLKGLSKYHPKMKALYITTHTHENDSYVEDINAHVKVVHVDKELKQGEVWSMAIAHVTTKYVLIAPHLVEFDDDINLKRMVRILSHNPDVAIVSGAYRTRNGHWDIGCQQSRFINYTLTLQGGYYMSFWECLICDITPGPWLARKKDLETLGFDKSNSAINSWFTLQSLDFGVFYDIFLRVKRQKRISVSCPDVMFNIDKPVIKDEWYLDFVMKHDIKKIVEPNGKVRWFGCRRGIKNRNGHSCSRPRGAGVPPCDLENLADAIKMIMRECEKAGLFCELQEGTLLGAVKFNKVLPWERDADLTFLTANYSAFKALGPVFKGAGYSFTAHDSSIWCCADGRKAGGKFSMYADGWSIELYGQHRMESEMLVARGEKPTKVDFAGQMVTVMRNPGLFARNRYGKLLYRHQEHWLDRGKVSGWHFYDPGVFEGCPEQGHSACLNQYSTDGNMQFGMNICPCTLSNPLR